MNPLDHVTLQCIYCDDIRDEVGGKTSIIGWYSGEPIAMPPEGFLLLPTFCLMGMLALPIDTQFKTLKLEMLQDEEVLHTVVIPEQAVKDLQTGEAHTATPLFGRQARFAIKMNNFAIVKPCIVRMRITLDDLVVNANGLPFKR